jgi:glycosyltransferase involved in cell wall biosynthesis
MLPNYTPREYLNAIDNCVKLHLFKHPRHLYYPSSLSMIYDIIKRITTFNPDVVHFQVSALPLYLLLPLLKLKRYPLIGTFHDVKLHIGEENLLTELMFRCARKHSDEIILHGGKLKKKMMRQYNIPEKRVHVISIGEHEVAPFKKYERTDLKEDGNLILFFGRIWEYKGLEYLINAEPLITKEVPNAKIIIAGTGEDFKKYENMMINRDNFIIHNYRIPYKEGAELFQRCSVVVLPYIEAPQSGVIPTTYGFKKPVVVTDVGSIPEVVDEGITGFIVPPRDEKALAEAIVKLLKDEELRKEMGKYGYRKLKTDLSWDNIMEKTIEVYKEAINEHKNKR